VARDLSVIIHDLAWDEGWIIAAMTSYLGARTDGPVGVELERMIGTDGMAIVAQWYKVLVTCKATVPSVEG